MKSHLLVQTPIYNARWEPSSPTKDDEYRHPIAQSENSAKSLCQ